MQVVSVAVRSSYRSRLPSISLTIAASWSTVFLGRSLCRPANSTA